MPKPPGCSPFCVKRCAEPLRRSISENQQNFNNGAKRPGLNELSGCGQSVFRIFCFPHSPGRCAKYLIGGAFDHPHVIAAIVIEVACKAARRKLMAIVEDGAVATSTIDHRQSSIGDFPASDSARPVARYVNTHGCVPAPEALEKFLWRDYFDEP